MSGLWISVLVVTLSHTLFLRINLLGIESFQNGTSLGFRCLTRLGRDKDFVNHFMQFLDTVINIILLAAVSLTRDLNHSLIIQKALILCPESLFDGIRDRFSLVKIPVQSDLGVYLVDVLPTSATAAGKRKRVF